MRPALDVWVEDYDDDVDPVAENHHHGLVPINLHLKVYLYAPTFVRFLFEPCLLVLQHNEEYDDCDAVDDAVPGDGVPVERDPPPGEEAADGDDSKDVEYSRSDDGADAKVALGHEGADHVREELGRARA